MPGLSLFHIVKLKPHTLIIGRIKPEHSGEYSFCVPEPGEAPQTEGVAVQATKERTVV